MTLYDLLKRISQILTPEDDAFYRYALYTSDDNGGFLRTRYCRSAQPVADHAVGEGFSRVLVTAKTPLCRYDLRDRSEPRAKLQITYSVPSADLSDADWDAQLGYCYVYLIDLQSGQFTEAYLPNPCP